MLREISGVDEAMVVGEGRPFCSALLWVDEANRDVRPHRLGSMRPCSSSTAVSPIPNR